jgi:hypothetical protein
MVVPSVLAPRSDLSPQPRARWKLQVAMIYPWKFGAALLSSNVHTLPGPIVGLVKALGGLVPKKVIVHIPDAAGSEVFAMT